MASKKTAPAKTPRCDTYEIWSRKGILSEILETIEGLSAAGMPKHAIASELGITEQTLKNLASKHSDLDDALRKGSAAIYAESTNFLLKVMRGEIEADVSTRVAIAQRFEAYKRQEFEALLSQKDGDSSGNNNFSFSLTIDGVDISK